ncbi:hypothetical protein RIF29_25913 [Crotalaria pallida]|uniref:Uncharacterized protein n=1 Tax=Crotalaria pallida TaxID=3830 RepID=A0AAN9EN17_CROPI
MQFAPHSFLLSFLPSYISACTRLPFFLSLSLSLTFSLRFLPLRSPSIQIPALLYLLALSVLTSLHPHLRKCNPKTAPPAATASLSRNH